MRRWRVWCAGLQPLPGRTIFCSWVGRRKAATEAAATRKPCPHCGGPVYAVDIGPLR